MNPLAGFSDWALALLPRMFLYPGGLAIVAALLLALFMPRPATDTTRTSVLNEALRLVAHVNIPALACVWAALSILPLPGVSPLPFPVDRFTLVAITAISLLFDFILKSKSNRDELWPNLAIVLALTSPAASQSGLVLGVAEPGVVDYLAGAAVLAGLVGLFDSVSYGWSQAARWLAWWGAAMALGMVPGGMWGFVSLPGAMVLGWTAHRQGWSRYATLLAYLLALAALLTSLLLPPG
ncbi:MAG: hypothetical protein M3441_08665 [Chloroflexota bacterium]|nr:hypothetical protein [Chloroflexota bacterium]